MLNESLLRSLLAFDDPGGVLSLYAGFTPERAADPQPTAPIELRNQIRELRQRLDEEADREHAQAVSDRLDELGDTLGGLLDPTAHGRGRAMFVAVNDGRRETVSLQMPFEERVVWRDRPFLRPLVAAHDEGRAAGIVVVHRGGIRILEWAVGEVEELEEREFDVTDAMVADVKSGPAANNPQMNQRGIVNRERFEDRIGENRHRFLKDALDDLLTLAEDRGWDRVVVAGSPKIRDEVHTGLAGLDGWEPILAEKSWEGDSPHAIAEQAWPLLQSVHREREVDLVERVREGALSGGAGALGVRDTLEAVNQGQVAHLLFSSDLQLSGYRSSAGTLHADEEGTGGLELEPERLLVERMVEKVIGMSGRVTPVDEEAAAILDEHGGVGALLRWS